MSWSYSGDPATSQLDAVRFWLQDTDTTFQLMSDEEIGYLLTTWGDATQYSEVRVAAAAAEVLANRFAREVSTSADGVSVAIGELQDRFDKLALNLRDQWRSLTAYTGSADFAGVLLDPNEDMADLKPLVFGVGFMDNYEVGQADFGYYSPGDYSGMLEAMVPGGRDG